MAFADIVLRDNGAVVFDISFGAAAPAITSIGDGSEPDTRAGVTITGSNFGASETGSAKVEISNNATYGAGIIVEIDATSWSATSITVTLVRESDLAALGTLFTLPLNPAYLWVTDSAGARNSVGFQFILKPAGATWYADLNTNITLLIDGIDVQKRLRIQIDNDGGTTVLPSFKWRYSLNGGSYIDITASSEIIRTKGTTFFADGDDITEALIGATALLTDNNAAEEDTGIFTMGENFTAVSDIEAELSFEIVEADVAPGDEIDIRIFVSDDTPFTTYTQTPRITIDKTGAVALVGSYSLFGVGT